MGGPPYIGPGPDIIIPGGCIGGDGMGGGRGCRMVRSSSSFVMTKASACCSLSSVPVIRQTCGPPGALAGNTEMWQPVPALVRRSLIVAPPGPMRPPTSSPGITISRGVPCSPRAVRPANARGDLLASTDRPASAGVPAGRIGRFCGGTGNRGTPSGIPFRARHSLIKFSAFSTSPTMEAVAYVSVGRNSTLISVPLRNRISSIVAPILPMTALI